MAEVIWSPVARDDLAAIAEYIGKDSPTRATVVVDRLLGAVERLSQYPRSGRVVPEIGAANSREILVGAYRVMYHLEPDVVTIVCIVHGARQWPPKQ
jgi:plasmid stabilization system protein ParE